MKLALSALLFLAPAAALAAGPQALGTFGDWTAAAYGAGPSKACYAFTTAKSSSLALPKRGPVMLTVTERKGAGDEVSIAAGYSYPKSATVSLSAGPTVVDFYTAGQSAFTTGGAKAIAAFQAQADATVKASGPHDSAVTDSFSLTGFSGAYGAIKKACS